MTILQELAALYERRAEEENWPPFGYSTEKIGAAVVLRPDGSVHDFRSLMSPVGKGDSLRPRQMPVPAAVRRTSGIKPNTFWDKSAYAIGITKLKDGSLGQKKRTLEEHNEFKKMHLNLLRGVEHPDLVAFRNFLEVWMPETFLDFPDAENLVDQNFVFQLENRLYLHKLSASQALLPRIGDGSSFCLATGRRGSESLLHPPIKGVFGAQSSGASLVSFNKDADKSRGKKQGTNAPVSEEAAFAYGTVLNAFLTAGSGNFLRIGGDTAVFWADQPEAEHSLDVLLEGGGNVAAESELRARIVALSEGRMRSGETLDPDARLFILGLAPNSARLAVRYWYPGTLGGFAKAVTDFWRDFAITPSPFRREGVEMMPKPKNLLYDIAVQRERKNIPGGLGGDLMRAILTGGRYPSTLLSAVIGRIRVEGEPEAKNRNVDGRRAAMIRAVLRRNHKQEVPMALDEKTNDPAYLLGRLFGAYYYAERSFQDRKAGLRQKYIGAASATPARIFPVLMRGYEHNLEGLRKAGGQQAGYGVKADRAVASILARLPGSGELPSTLPLEAQGRFFVGFYHQISAFYAKAEDAVDALNGEDRTKGN